MGEMANKWKNVLCSEESKTYSSDLHEIFSVKLTPDVTTNKHISTVQ